MSVCGVDIFQTLIFAYIIANFSWKKQPVTLSEQERNPAIKKDFSRLGIKAVAVPEEPFLLLSRCLFMQQM